MGIDRSSLSIAVDNILLGSILKLEELLEDSCCGVNIIKGGKTMNKGTVIFFSAIGLVLVLVVFAIGRTFVWW
jgi:hypothetical protein